MMGRERIDRRRYPDAAKLEAARYMRSNPTSAERLVWSWVRNRGMLGLKFRRQHIVDGFIVDFYCAELSLVLELDGPHHRNESQTEYDRARTDRLRLNGCQVVRLQSDELRR